MRKGWQIVGGRLVDPATGRDEVADLFIDDGIIVPTRPPPPRDMELIQARGLTVVPGFIDLHVHFREPGNEEAETIESGSLAAARGGFTTVVTMPNTTPPIDSAERVAWQARRGHSVGRVRLLPSGCITAGRQGRTLAPLAAMKQAGAVAFTDDGTTVLDDALMIHAMKVALELGTPLMDHALDPTAKGVLHEGSASQRLALPGIAAEAEIRMVRRDLDLAALTGCAIHIQHVSTEESVRLIRNARAKGWRVSGEATPHHLALCEEDICSGDPNFKMSPPLRSAADQAAIRAAVIDGTLQALATDHAPHRQTDKNKGFLDAPFGVVGLETAVGVTYGELVKPGLMTLLEWVRRWTIGPALVLGIDAPSLAPGRPADVTLLDLDAAWQVKPESFLSRSRNSPFIGRKLTGRPLCTLRAGRMTWDGRGETAC